MNFKKSFNYFDLNYEDLENLLKNNLKENFSDETKKSESVTLADVDDCDENYKILDEDKSQYCHKNKDGTYILKSRSEKKSTCSHDNQCKEGLKCGDDDECVEKEDLNYKLFKGDCYNTDYLSKEKCESEHYNSKGWQKGGSDNNGVCVYNIAPSECNTSKLTLEKPIFNTCYISMKVKDKESCKEKFDKLDIEFDDETGICSSNQISEKECKKPYNQRRKGYTQKKPEFVKCYKKGYFDDVKKCTKEDNRDPEYDNGLCSVDGISKEFCKILGTEEKPIYKKCYSKTYMKKEDCEKEYDNDDTFRVKQKGVYEDGVCSFMRKDCDIKSTFSEFPDTVDEEPNFKKCYIHSRIDDKDTCSKFKLIKLHPTFNIPQRYKGSLMYDETEKLCYMYSDKCDYTVTHEEKPKAEDFVKCYSIEKKSKESCKGPQEFFDDEKKLCMLGVSKKVCEKHAGTLSDPVFKKCYVKMIPVDKELLKSKIAEKKLFFTEDKIPYVLATTCDHPKFVDMVTENKINKEEFKKCFINLLTPNVGPDKSIGKMTKSVCDKMEKMYKDIILSHGIKQCHSDKIKSIHGEKGFDKFLNLQELAKKDCSSEEPESDDSIEGTPEVDSVEGTPEVDSVAGTPEVDSVVGTPEVDSVVGTPEVDSVVGTPEVDSVVGTPTADRSKDIVNVIGNTKVPKKLPVKVVKKKKKLNLPLILGIGGGIILLIVFIIIMAGSKKNSKSQNDLGDGLDF